MKGGIDTLIEALTIFRKYANPRNPTHCEHDKLIVCIDPDKVSDEDKKILNGLSFNISEADECFYSYQFGSA